MAESHKGLVSESRSWFWIAIDCCKAFGVSHSLWNKNGKHLEFRFEKMVEIWDGKIKMKSKKGQDDDKKELFS